MRQLRFLLSFAMAAVMLFAMSGISAAETITYSSAVAHYLGSINASIQLPAQGILSAGLAAISSKNGLPEAVDANGGWSSVQVSDSYAAVRADVIDSGIASREHLYVSNETQIVESPVPEPATLALVFSGLLAAGSGFRKHGRKAGKETV